MQNCPSCGATTSEDGANHCPFCGAAFQQGQPAVVTDHPPFPPSPSSVQDTGRFSLVLAVEKGIPSGETMLDLKAEETVIGRSEQADFRVKLPSISRKHATVWVEGGAAYVKDLGSQHGTYVNYREISEPTLLHPGDRISLGRDIHFQLIVDDEADELEPEQIAKADIDLPPARPVSGDLPKLEAQSKARPEPKEYMEVASSFCTATAKLGSEQELFDAVLDHLGRLIRADRYYIMTGRALETLKIAAERGGVGDVAPSKGIIRRVLYSLSDRPYITCDAQSEKGIRERSSIVLGNIRSVMCVGLVSGTHCDGMIYVDTQGAQEDVAFSSLDEHCFHIIGQLTAARLANLRAQSELEALQDELQTRRGGGSGLSPDEIT